MPCGRENVEMPAGIIEAAQRDFTVRIDRSHRSPEEFAALPLAKGQRRIMVRLGEVAQVELGSTDRRNMLRGNAVLQVGMGVVKQSTANRRRRRGREGRGGENFGDPAARHDPERGLRRVPPTSIRPSTRSIRWASPCCW